MWAAGQEEWGVGCWSGGMGCGLLVRRNGVWAAAQDDWGVGCWSGGTGCGLCSVMEHSRRKDAKTEEVAIGKSTKRGLIG